MRRGSVHRHRRRRWRARATGGLRACASAGCDAASDAAFVKQYCLTCHNSRAKAGGLALDALNPLNVDGHAEAWEKVVRKLRTG